MNKCLIYMYYDREGLVRKSTLQLLDEFHKIVDYIYFVSNNELHNKNQIIASVDDLIIRKNEGYDAGAYRDVLLNNNVDRWDQIIFCNNTFWGPFVALDSLFQKMDETNADYWGLSYSGKNLVHHIQSYFMVFNKKVIPELKKYFVEYISSGKQSYREICRTFEMGLNDYLLKKGFKYRAYSDNIAYDPYSDPYGSVKYDDLPILKKKIFDENFYNQLQVESVLPLIEEKYNYNVSTILEEAFELYGRKIDFRTEVLRVKPEINQNAKMKNWNEVSKFIECNKDIAVFGTGRMLEHVLGIFFSGNSRDKLVGIVGLGEIKDIGVEEAEYWKYIFKDCAIIVCVNEKDAEAAYDFFENYSNVFFVWKQFGVYKNNIVKLSDSIITAYGKFFYYKMPLVIVDEDGKYCGMITEKEVKEVYTFSEETSAMAIANITIPTFVDVEEAKMYAAKNSIVVPLVDKKGKYIKLIRG